MPEILFTINVDIIHLVQCTFNFIFLKKCSMFGQQVQNILSTRTPISVMVGGVR